MNRKNIYNWLGILVIAQILVLQPVLLKAQDEGKPNDVVQTIEKMKGAKSWPEMSSLAQSLFDIGKPASKEILKAFQDKNNEKMFRKLLSDMLGQIKDKEVMPGIVNVLQDEKEDPFIRTAAAQCLGTMGYPEASAPLMGQLKNENADIRSMAVFSLGFLKDQNAISAIGEMTKDRDEHVRNRAARALGKLENPAGIDYLTPLLNDKVNHVRLASIQSLGIIGTEKSVGPLLDRLRTATEVTEKGTIIRALGQTKSQKAADPLLNILQGKDSYLMINAVEALALIGDKRAIPLIENKLKTTTGNDFAQKKFREAYNKLTEKDSVK